jgi:hypothetical protein
LTPPKEEATPFGRALPPGEERKSRCDQITKILANRTKTPIRHNIPSGAIIKAIFQFDDCCDNPFVGYVALLRFPLAAL